MSLSPSRAIAAFNDGRVSQKPDANVRRQRPRDVSSKPCVVSSVNSIICPSVATNVSRTSYSLSDRATAVSRSFRRSIKRRCVIATPLNTRGVYESAKLPIVVTASRSNVLTCLRVPCRTCSCFTRSVHRASSPLSRAVAYHPIAATNTVRNVRSGDSAPVTSVMCFNAEGDALDKAQHRRNATMTKPPMIGTIKIGSMLRGTRERLVGGRFTSRVTSGATGPSSAVARVQPPAPERDRVRGAARSPRRDRRRRYPAPGVNATLGHEAPSLLC
jgi:hypothetical protein